MQTADTLLDPREFSHALTATVAPVRVRGGAALAALYRDLDDGRDHLGRIAAGAHSARGGAAPASSSTLVCNYLLRGRASVVQDGASVVAGPGDFWWFRTDLPYTLTFDSDFELVGILTARRRLPALAAGPAAGMHAADAVVAALAQAVDALERAATLADPLTRGRLIAQVLDIAETTSVHAVTTAGAPGRSDLLARALACIDDRLAAPDLSPPVIAALLHVSVRSLHNAFAAAGVTVSASIRIRRLERCRRDLCDPALRHLGVAEIAARWGMVSPSRFSTLFHEAYGVAPSDLRRGLGIALAAPGA